MTKKIIVLILISALLLGTLYIMSKIENTKAIEMLNIIKEEYNMYLSNATETGEKNSVGLIIYFSDDIEKNADEITKNAIIDLINRYIETREYDKDYGYFKISNGVRGIV